MSYIVDRHERFGEGIYRLTSANNPEYPEGAMWDALNMVYQRSSEDPEKMGGYSRLGTTDMGGNITGLADYDEGTRLIAGCADGKLYEYAGTDFAASTGGTGFSTGAGTRWSFAMYYGDTTNANLMVGCNGVQAPQKYTSAAGWSALGGSPPATGKYPIAFAGRLWMVSGDTLFYSATNDCEVWTTTGGSFQVERGSGDITGLHVAAGNLLIFKRRKIFRLLPGTTLASTSIREVNGRIGTPSHFTIQEVGANETGTLYWVSDTGPQGLSISSATGGFRPVQIADAIKPYLDARVDKTNQATSWAHFNEDRSEYYYQYGTNSSTPSEGVIANLARHQERPRWTRHNMNGMSAGATYRISGEEIQAFGDSNGRVYRMHVGHDRNTSGYVGRIMTAAYAQGRRDTMKKYGRTFIDAEGQSNISAKMNMGRAGHPGTASNADSLTDLTTLDGWGTGTWGDATWGGSTITGTWVRLSSVAKGHYQRLILETLGANQWFKVNGIGIEHIYLGRKTSAA
jgi:hypothetical protein